MHHVHWLILHLSVWYSVDLVGQLHLSTRNFRSNMIILFSWRWTLMKTLRRLLNMECQVSLWRCINNSTLYSFLLLSSQGSNKFTYFLQRQLCQRFCSSSVSFTSCLFSEQTNTRTYPKSLHQFRRWWGRWQDDGGESYETSRAIGGASVKLMYLKK
jgi:hypothetical protein